MKKSDRESLIDWDAYRKNLVAATSIDMDEDPVSQRKRIDELKTDFQKFSKYYFPHYCKSDFASFHKKSVDEIIEHAVLYATMEMARDHAKSVVFGVLVPTYLKFTGKLKNMLYVSFNEDKAIELLKPLKINFESNQRIIHDFGVQTSISNWEAGRFVTTDSCSFRAIGSGQDPRGTRNEEARPDFILVDDIDNTEVCRNPDRLTNTWDWVNGDLYGCFSIQGDKRFIVVGNRIAKDSIVVRAKEKSDYTITVNLLDNNGLPMWKERFTLDECNYMIKKMGYRLSQREYFNNPITEGKVFKKDWIQFKKLMPIRQYRYLIAYLDPGFKKTKTSDTKSLLLVGLHQSKFHLLKAFVGQASIEEMIEWCYAMDSLVKGNGGSYRLRMEEVFLQSLLYKDFSAAAIKKGYPVPVSGDTRKKPEKDARIESLGGYFERGEVYFNEDEKDNHHMQAVVEQFLSFEPGVKTKKDAPDAFEGAVYELQLAISTNYDNLKTGSRPKNSRRV